MQHSPPTLFRPLLQFPQAPIDRFTREHRHVVGRCPEPVLRTRHKEMAADFDPDQSPSLALAVSCNMMGYTSNVRTLLYFAVPAFAGALRNQRRNTPPLFCFFASRCAEFLRVHFADFFAGGFSTARAVTASTVTSMLDASVCVGDGSLSTEMRLLGRTSTMFVALCRCCIPRSHSLQLSDLFILHIQLIAKQLVHRLKCSRRSRPDIRSGVVDATTPLLHRSPTPRRLRRTPSDSTLHPSIRPVVTIRQTTRLTNGRRFDKAARPFVSVVPPHSSLGLQKPMDPCRTPCDRADV